VLFSTPFVWLVLSSLKQSTELYVYPPKWIPEVLENWPIALEDLIKNYKDALVYIPYFTYVGNTVYLTMMNIIGQLFAVSFVAYSFARLKWRGRNVFFVILISTMVLPGQVTMIPAFLIFKALGWYNSFKPLWVPSFFGSAFNIFLLRQFYLTIPKDLDDSAKIDGAGPFRIYWYIMLPLVRPVLIVIAIFTFLGAWNDFIGPLIYLNDPELTPIALGLQVFKSAHGSEFGMLMAAATVMTVPIIVLFFLAQRYFIQGITLTGMKVPPQPLKGSQPFKGYPFIPVNVIP
jgi:ABC-type glycerol-3-phosphate transport system permease component